MTAFVLSVALTVAPTVLPDVERLQNGVNAARTKAIEYLKKAQNAQGTWEGTVVGFLVDMDGGSTALVVLALFEAGLAANDPALAKAIEYIEKLEPKKTYVVSLQAQVLARVDAKKYAKQIQVNADWLLKTAIKKDGQLEGWSYPQNQIADGSNTHFAVVGLHAAVSAGAKVDPKVWDQIGDLYVRTQGKDGGWPYYSDGNASSSVNMTGAALVGLTTTASYGPEAKKRVAFEAGMAAYLDMGIESPKSTAYHLMVIAKLGRLLDVTTFETEKKSRTWYRHGAEKLLKEQKADGSWVFGRQVDATPHLATAFALYFLGPPPAKK